MAARGTINGAIAIIAAGVAVRLLLLPIVDPSAQMFSGDSVYYSAGIVDGYRPPLYVLFLRATLPFGAWFPLFIQCGMTIASGLAAYLFLRSFWAGLIIAACPFFALFDFRLLSESLYVNLLWWGWIALYRERSIGAGLLVGLSILTRDTLLLLPLFAFVMLRTRRSAIMAAVAYLTILPWIAYNGSISQGRMGLNLWIGTWERNGDWYLDGLSNPDFPPYAFTSPAEERAVKAAWGHDDATLKHLAIRRIIEHPGATAKAWAIRYPRLWLGTRADQIAFRLERWSLAWIVAKSTFFGLNLLLLGLGVFGLWKRRGPFAIPVFYIALIYVPFHNCETRYSLPALPFLCFFTAIIVPARWPEE
jgi:hypothetical protein